MISLPSLSLIDFLLLFNLSITWFSCLLSLSFHSAYSLPLTFILNWEYFPSKSQEFKIFAELIINSDSSEYTINTFNIKILNYWDRITIYPNPKFYLCWSLLTFPTFLWDWRATTVLTRHLTFPTFLEHTLPFWK